MLMHVPPDASVLAMDVHKNTISAAVLVRGPGWVGTGRLPSFRVATPGGDLTDGHCSK